jgi:hypothetical protein
VQSWQSCIWPELFACMVFWRELYLIEVHNSPLSSRRNCMSHWTLGRISAEPIIRKLTGKLNGQIKFWKTCSGPVLWSMGRAWIKAFYMQNSHTITVIKLAWRCLRSKHCMAGCVGCRCSRMRPVRAKCSDQMCWKCGEASSNHSWESQGCTIVTEELCW